MNLPVVIYLHEYDYSKGFNSYQRIEELYSLTEGFAVFTFDLIDSGTVLRRNALLCCIPTGQNLAKWLPIPGRCGALSNMDFEGLLLPAIAGGDGGLYGGLDNRIAAAVRCRFHTDAHQHIERETEGIQFSPSWTAAETALWEAKRIFRWISMRL